MFIILYNILTLFLLHLSDDLYEYLKVELTKCLLDKEAGGDDNHGKYVIEKFIGMLHNDPSVEVRCAVIYNIEYNEETLAYILQRAHRSNKSSKCFYENAEEINDFHVLSIEDREKLLSWGLTVRDPHVKKACI
ncbi:hypothetical protein C2G38_2248074, partial [Gigaspora rosea]